MAAAAATVAAGVALAGCGGSAAGHPNPKALGPGGGIRGALPPIGRPRRGGTITFGQVAGQTPLDIFPLVGETGCTTSTLNFIQDQYIPLYAGPNGARPAIDEGLSAAAWPRYSDGDRTVTIRLKGDLRWSDGKPVVAQDVIFYLDLLRAALRVSPANWCQYSAGGLPDNVASWTARGARVVVLHLRHPVNPSWFTADQLQDVGAGVYPLPSRDWDIDSAHGEPVTDWATNPADALKIYDYLSRQGAERSRFSANALWKVVDGPFRLKDFRASSGAYDLVPNPTYGLKPRARVSHISVITYSGSATMLQALKRGDLEIGSLDPSTQSGSIRRLRRRGVRVFGGPVWGWFGGVVNFRDAADDFAKIIAQPYARGVLAELVDQAKIIRHVYHGWAVPAHGPAPTALRSPYLSAAATRAAWPYDPAKAAATLRAHGWRVRPGGQTTCRRPGRGVGECGAGIPVGTPLRFVWANLPKSVAPAETLESRIFAADARRAAGIDVSFVTGSFSFLTAEYNDQNPGAAGYINDWGVNNYGGALGDYYPTQQGLLSRGGSLNLGAYVDSVADRLMAASVSSPSARAIDAEVAHLGRAYPVLYMPDEDWIVAVSSRVGGGQAAFRAMTQQRYPFQFLYRVKSK